MNMQMVIVAVAVLFGVSTAFAELSVNRVFSDHMVLQRDAPWRIWGTADVGTQVIVRFGDQKATATAANDGRWSASLKPLKASTKPATLRIEAGDANKTIEIKDVLVGDVWVGSGQSNMAGRVASYEKNDETLAALRKKSYTHIRLAQGHNPTWAVATPENISSFSALLFPFGERLNRELDVPIGLIVGAVGGTPSGSWIPPETFANSKRCKASIGEFSKSYDREAAMKKYQRALAVWEKRATEAKAAGNKVRGRKPTPPPEPGGSTRGGKIGGLFERYIQPVVGFRIRGVLWDQGEAGSGVLGVDQFTMMSELIRGWREAWGQGEFPFLFVQKPSGGGCAFASDDPITRNASPFSKQPPQTSTLGSSTLDRYLYVRLMNANPKAWMIPCSDLGGTIHPPNKWGYGNRAAEVALNRIYGRDLQAYGPIYQKHTIHGNRMVIHFDEVGQGLVAAHSDTLQGFAIAGDDGNWHWATAKINGDSVELSSDAVAKPVRACYAFGRQISWANLFNKDGKHALCFITDESAALALPTNLGSFDQ